MKINKWLEASLFKRFIETNVGITNIYFFTDAPVDPAAFPSTEGTAYWTDNALASKVLLDINLSPAETWDIGSPNPDLDITLTWQSTSYWNGAQDGVANWFLMTNSDKTPIFMGQVSGPNGGGDIELSNNTIVTGQRYKIYKYVLDYNQL